jgi:hypothetical protein
MYHADHTGMARDIHALPGEGTFNTKSTKSTKGANK